MKEVCCTFSPLHLQGSATMVAEFKVYHFSFVLTGFPFFSLPFFFFSSCLPFLIKKISVLSILHHNNVIKLTHSFHIFSNTLLIIVVSPQRIFSDDLCYTKSLKS